MPADQSTGTVTAVGPVPVQVRTTGTGTVMHEHTVKTYRETYRAPPCNFAYFTDATDHAHPLSMFHRSLLHILSTHGVSHYRYRKMYTCICRSTKSGLIHKTIVKLHVSSVPFLHTGFRTPGVDVSSVPFPLVIYTRSLAL
jgi:hypothetical protein